MSISEENDYDSFQKGLTEQRICKLKTPSRTSGKAANDIFPMPEGSKFVESYRTQYLYFNFNFIMNMIKNRTDLCTY